jgi:hypothetical protein
VPNTRKPTFKPHFRIKIVRNHCKRTVADDLKRLFRSISAHDALVKSLPIQQPEGDTSSRKP